MFFPSVSTWVLHSSLTVFNLALAMTVETAQWWWWRVRPFVGRPVRPSVHLSACSSLKKQCFWQISALKFSISICRKIFEMFVYLLNTWKVASVSVVVVVVAVSNTGIVCLFVSLFIFVWSSYFNIDINCCCWPMWWAVLGDGLCSMRLHSGLAGKSYRDEISPILGWDFSRWFWENKGPISCSQGKVKLENGFLERFNLHF